MIYDMFIIIISSTISRPKFLPRLVHNDVASSLRAAVGTRLRVRACVGAFNITIIIITIIIIIISSSRSSRRMRMRTRMRMRMRMRLLRCGFLLAAISWPQEIPVDVPVLGKYARENRKVLDNGLYKLNHHNMWNL